MPILFEPRVEISIGTGLTEENAHGSLWVQTRVDGVVRNVRTYFVLSKPQCVKAGLSFGVWHSLIKQIKKMGLTATHIEITANDKHYCYAADRYSELYAGAVGRSVARSGFA